MDSLLIIADKKGDTVLNIFNTSGRLLTRLIQRGKSESGIRMAGDIQQDYANHAFLVYDLFSHKILKLSVPDMLTNAAYQPTLYASLTADSVFSYSMDKIFDGKDFFIGESRKGQRRLVTFNKQLQDRHYFLAAPPKVDTSLSDKENMSLYSIGVAFNPERTKMATATYAAGLLNILNITANGLDSVWSVNMFSPIGLERLTTDNGNVLVHTANSLSGYSDICATEKYVYAIFSGKRFKDPNYTYSTIIHIMTWDGKKRYKLILDREISRLTVTLDDAILYGVAMNEKEEPEILSFSIKDLIK
jgi:hypothetical protein